MARQSSNLTGAEVDTAREMLGSTVSKRPRAARGDVLLGRALGFKGMGEKRRVGVLVGLGCWVAFLRATMANTAVAKWATSPATGLKQRAGDILWFL